MDVKQQIIKHALWLEKLGQGIQYGDEYNINTNFVSKDGQFLDDPVIAIDTRVDVIHVLY